MYKAYGISWIKPFGSRGIYAGVSSMLSRTPLFMSEICWRSGVPSEGEREGERESEAGGLRVEAEDEMPKFKIQMTNDGVRSTSTNNGHATRTLSEGESGQQTRKH
jgi:hypothetical protein